MALGQQRRGRRAVAQREGAHQPRTTPELAVAGAGLGELVGGDEHRHRPFDRLDRGVERVGHVRVDAVDPIHMGSRAHPAAVGLVERPRLARTVEAADHHVVHRAAALRGDAAGCELGQRAQHQIGVAHRGLDVARAHRRRAARVEQTAFGDLHRDGRKRPVVHRDARVGHRAHRVVHPRKRHAVDRVERHGALGCGAGVVECERVAVLFEPHAQDDRRFAALVFHHVFVGDHAVGQRAQRRARAAFAVGERLVERGFDGRDAVALDQLEEAALADVVSGDLRAQVSGPRLGGAGIGAQEIDRLVDHAVVAHQHGRDEHRALGEEIARVGRHRTGDRAADVGVVRFVGGVADEPAGVIDGANHRDVVEVRAGQIGIVDDDHLARPQLATVLDEPSEAAP